LSSYDSHNTSFSNRDRNLVPFYDSMIETNYNKDMIQPALYRLNYSGIFLVDAADSMMVIGIAEILNWFFITKGHSKLPYR